MVAARDPRDVSLLSTTVPRRTAGIGAKGLCLKIHVLIEKVGKEADVTTRMITTP